MKHAFYLIWQDSRGKFNLRLMDTQGTTVVCYKFNSYSKALKAAKLLTCKKTNRAA